MATPGKRARLPRDQAFKAILSHPRMIADAVRGYAARPVGPLDPRTVAALDFNTLEKLPTEWITPDFRRRLGDQVWRVRFRWAPDWSDPGGYLLILVEFQSRRAPDMALRMASYALHLYADLAIVRVVRPGGPRPPILPLLIHNGRGRWTASTTLDGLIARPTPLAATRDLAAFQLGHAHWLLDFHRHREDDARADNAMSTMIRLESAAMPSDLVAPLLFLRRLPERDLAGGMLAWALRRLDVDAKTAEEMRAMASLDEFWSQLEETAKGWPEQFRAEGRAEGIERGMEQGIERGIEQGIEQGIERGRAEAVAAQRVGLREQAALRFGGSAERLDPLLDGVDSPAKLVEIGRWLMVDTIDELVAKIEAAAGEPIH